MNFFSLFKRKIIFFFKKKIDLDSQKVKTKKKIDYLFSYYGTDKSNKWHGFSEFYEKHFFKFKNKKIASLEIGSHEGGSAAAFAKYFTNSSIICLDINITRFKYSSKRIKLIGLDASNEKSIKNFFEKQKIIKSYFDIIIDDGSHKTSDILFALKNTFDYLKPGGSYVIEDYKLADFFNYFHNTKDVTPSFLLKNLKNKKYFKSSIINKKFQKKLFNNIKKINFYSGKFIYGKNTNSTSSDICFITRKWF